MTNIPDNWHLGSGINTFCVTPDLEIVSSMRIACKWSRPEMIL